MAAGNLNFNLLNCASSRYVAYRGYNITTVLLRRITTKFKDGTTIRSSLMAHFWDGVGKRSYIMPKRNEPGVSVQHRGRLAVGRIIIMYAAAEVSD